MPGRKQGASTTKLLPSVKDGVAVPALVKWVNLNVPPPAKGADKVPPASTTDPPA